MGKRRCKKSAENIWKGRKKVLIFAPALRERRRLQPRDFDQSDEVLRSFGKDLSKRFGRFGKGSYLCSPQGGQHDREASERVLEVFEAEKILKKDLEVSKKVLTFAPLSAEKTAVSQGARRSDRNPAEIRNCSYRNIRTAFFEVIEQLKFSTLEKE